MQGARQMVISEATQVMTRQADKSRAVPLAVHGGRAPGPRVRARAFARIEDTLSVLDEGTGLTHSRQDLAACM